MFGIIGCDTQVWYLSDSLVSSRPVRCPWVCGSQRDQHSATTQQLMMCISTGQWTTCIWKEEGMMSSLSPKSSFTIKAALAGDLLEPGFNRPQVGTERFPLQASNGANVPTSSVWSVAAFATISFSHGFRRVAEQWLAVNQQELRVWDRDKQLMERRPLPSKNKA